MSWRRSEHGARPAGASGYARRLLALASEVEDRSAWDPATFDDVLERATRWITEERKRRHDPT